MLFNELSLIEIKKPNSFSRKCGRCHEMSSHSPCFLSLQKPPFKFVIELCIRERGERPSEGFIGRGSGEWDWLVDAVNLMQLDSVLQRSAESALQRITWGNCAEFWAPAGLKVLAC